MPGSISDPQVGYLNLAGAETGDLGEALSIGLGSDVDPPVLEAQTAIKHAGAYSWHVYNGSGTGSTPAVHSYARFGKVKPDGTHTLANVGSLYFRIWVRFAAFPASGLDEDFITILDETGALRCSLSVASNGTISFRNTTRVATSTGTTVLITGVWYELHVFVGSGVSTAPYEAKINGVVEFNSTFSSSVNSGAVSIGTERTASNTYRAYFDDLSMRDDQYPGHGVVRILTPNGSGSTTEWSLDAVLPATNASNDYSSVNEIPVDAGGDQYVSSIVDGDAHLFNLTDFSSISTIAPLAVKASAYLSAASPATSGCVLRMHSSSTDFDTTGTTWPITRQLIQQLRQLDPNGNVAWTASAVDALEIGAVNASGGSTKVGIHAIWLMVDCVPEKLADHSTDSTIKAVDYSRTHTSNSLLWSSIPAIHSTDSLIKSSTVLSHTSDSVLKSTSSFIITSDSLLRSVRTTSHSTDSLIKSSFTSAHTISSFLRLTSVSISSSDTVLRVLQQSDNSTDALIRSVGLSVVSTFDSVLKKSDVVRTQTTDSIIFLSLNGIHDSNALLRSTVVRTHQSDALLILSSVVSHQFDSAFSGSRSVMSSFDASLKSNIRSSTTDARLRLVGVVGTRSRTQRIGTRSPSFKHVNMNERKLNSTDHPIGILMVSDGDHITGQPSLTVTVTISKDGGLTFNPAVGAVVDSNYGWYSWTGNALDRDSLGELWVHATAPGCDPYDEKYTIVSYDPFTGANTQTERDAIADSLLVRDWAAVTMTVASRSLLNAARFLRNKWVHTRTGDLTITQEDDVTVAWTGNTRP